jgi:hypothetical protein
MDAFSVLRPKAQVVSRRLLTAVALIQNQVGLYGICGEQIGTKNFSDYFEFSVTFTFSPKLHTHLLSGAGTIGQFEVTVPRDPVLTHPYNNNNNTKNNFPKTLKLRSLKT